jgi:hypothetical protein
MAKRRKPKETLKPLEIVDDRNQADRRQWRTVTGKVESEITNVSHWQPLPDYPRSIDHE